MNGFNYRQKKIFYISYDGALDLLGHSQIIPYLLGLSQKGFRFIILTYEKKYNLQNRQNLNNFKELLALHNIEWEILTYHKSPTLPATTLDIFMGIIKGFSILLKYKAEIIHARSFVGTIPALILAKLFHLEFIYDLRGFWADERIDGGIWVSKGLLYKTAKWLERFILNKADWIVCLTQEGRKILSEFYYLKVKTDRISVIPTCVDTSRFVIREKNADLLKKHNLQNRFIFIYFGSIGTWYMIDEMIDFFKVAKTIDPDSFFLILSPDKNTITIKMVKKGIEREDFIVESVSYAEIPSWISLADVSMFFIKPLYSKKSSCPTKYAESLACGLPVIINSGIGDCDEIIRKEKVGVIISNFSLGEYRRAISELNNLLFEAKFLKERCSSVAKKYFSLDIGIERYQDIYSKLQW